jgi:hypothetical protein
MQVGLTIERRRSHLSSQQAAAAASKDPVGESQSPTTGDYISNHHHFQDSSDESMIQSRGRWNLTEAEEELSASAQSRTTVRYVMYVWTGGHMEIGPL